MPNNPLTQQELYDYGILRILTPPTPAGTVPSAPYFPPGYFLVPPHDVDGIVAWRKFHAGYITEGLIDPDRLGTGSLGFGDLYLADDGTWKIVSGLLPPGGTTGQILAKIDGVDYNTEWIDNYTSSVKHEVKLGENMSKGTPVYVSGTTGGSGTNMIVSKASNATEMTSSKTMGLIATGGVTNDFVFVVTEGLLAGLDTSTAIAGDPVWLGPNGTLLFGLANKPVAPAHMVALGVVTRVSTNNGEIFVKVQNGFEIEELHDVLITSKANNDLLVYESATSLWKNKTISSIFGGTPLVTTPTLAQVTTAGNTTTNSITVGGLTTNQSVTASGAIARGVYFNNTLVAAANNDVLVGLDVNPTFTNGAFTNLGNYPLRVTGTGILGYYRNSSGGVGNSANGVTIGVDSSGNGLITAYNYTPADPTSGISVGANFGLNGSTTNFYGIGLAALRSSKYDIWFQTGAINGGGYRFYKGTTELFTIFQSGNVGINTTTDAGFKLDVNGTTRLNGLTSINSTTVANTALAIAATGTGAGHFIIQGYDASANNRFHITASGNFRINGLTDNGPSGSDEKFRLNLSFAPTSGTREHFGLWLRQTINQTGGANGITRGIYVNPILTSAADFRAIETSAGKIIHQGLTNATQTNQVYYNTTTGELTYGALPVSAAITSTQISNWDTAYGWGNHATAGYLTGTTGYNGIFTVSTNPPGQQNLQIVNGLIVNVF